MNALENLEKRVSTLEKKLKIYIVKRDANLAEKFRLHDRSQNLLREFESMHVPLNRQLSTVEAEQLKTIVLCLVKLVDNALGV